MTPNISSTAPRPPPIRTTTRDDSRVPLAPFSGTDPNARQLAPLVLRHHLAERAIDPGLVAPALLLEPGQNIGVQTQRNRLLERLVVSPPLRGQLRRKFLPFGRSPQPPNLPPLLDLLPFFHEVVIGLYVQKSNHKMFHVEYCTYKVFHVKHCTYSASCPASRRQAVNPMIPNRLEKRPKNSPSLPGSAGMGWAKGCG